MTIINPRTATVTIYHGDDLERLADLHRAAEVAARREEGAAFRVGDDSEAANARDAYNAAVDEAAERAVVVRLNQVGRKTFRALLTEHPPREGSKGDEAQGFNDETFPEALLRASIVEPEFPSQADRDTFLDSLADGDFDRLFFTAYELNRAVSADPKATRFSEDIPRSSETSESPARLG